MDDVKSKLRKVRRRVDDALEIIEIMEEDAEEMELPMREGRGVLPVELREVKEAVTGRKEPLIQELGQPIETEETGVSRQAEKAGRSFWGGKKKNKRIDEELFG